MLACEVTCVRKQKIKLKLVKNTKIDQTHKSNIEEKFQNESIDYNTNFYRDKK